MFRAHRRAQAGGHAVGDALEAAALGVVENRLVGVALGADAYARAQYVVYRRVGHAPGHPVAGEEVQVALPDLLVVGIHEVLGDAVAETPLHPLAEGLGRLGTILGALVPGLHVAGQAIEGGFLRQITDAVFEGVMHPAIFEADLGVTVALVEGFGPTGLVLHPVHGVLVLAEQDVSAGYVVGESVDFLGATQSTGHGSCFEQDDVGGIHASLHQEAGEGQAGDAGTEDRDFGHGEIPAGPAAIGEGRLAAFGGNGAPKGTRWLPGGIPPAPEMPPIKGT